MVSFYTKVLAAVPDLAWCLLPSEPHSEKAHPNSPPQVNFALQAKGTDQDPGTTQRVIPPQLTMME